MKLNFVQILFLSIILFLLEILFQVPIRKVIGLRITFWIQLFFCCILIYEMAHIIDLKRFKLLVFPIIFFTFLITIDVYNFDLSERIFIGKEIANSYWAEAPGYTLLRLFENHKATVTYGGVQGDTEIDYGRYSIKQGKVILYFDEKVNLESSAINIDSKTYDLVY